MSERYSATDRLDWAVAFLVFGVVLACLLATMQMGFTRDESFYFHAAFQYIRWFEELYANFQSGSISPSFTQANIDKHWGYNPEHPVLMKTLFALSFKLFHQHLDWMSASTALRFPGAVFAAGLCSALYLWTRQLFGRMAGVIAVGALLFQPRFFFHAHMACFDVPIVALWFAVMYAYWRSYESKRWAIATGLLWGLALSTKLNAFFLPIVMLGHWAVAHWSSWGVSKRGLRIPPFPRAFWAMAVLGPVLFYLLWPRHWFDTSARIQWYMNFHLKHVHYFVYYFGQNVQQPPLPISYPWVMTVLTVPVTVLVAFFAGVWAWVKGDEREVADDRGTGLLLAINLLFPIALISMPATPIFGGVKHWMPAMPFVAMLAGGGVVWCVRSVNHGQSRVMAELAVGAFVLSTAIYSTFHIHPFGTSYYNELIGSTRGAADREMMRQFWGYTSRQALPWVNEHAKPNARIFTGNTTGYAWGMYNRDKMRRSDLRPSPLGGSDFSLFHHQKSFVHREIEIWERYQTRAPVHVVDVDGVPVLSVYTKKRN